MRTTIKPRTTKSVSTLTKEMDSVFALYVKLRDCDASGTVTCFVTGERAYYLDCDAAHLFNRQYMSTRWNEMNVHACTVETNRYESDHITKYKARFIDVFGNDEYAAIHIMAHSFMKFTSAELIQMIEIYKDKVAQLKLEKGL